MLIPLTVATTDASPEGQWLTERSEAVGFVALIISDMFGNRGATWSYDFACPPEPTGGGVLFLSRLTLLVTEVEEKR